jgi:membrane protein required for colicin V production
MESVQLSAYDFVILGIIVLFVGRGIWLGFLKQIIPLLALYFGYFAASRYHDILFPFLRDISENPKVVFLSAYVILFGVTYLFATLLGKGLSYVIQISIASWFDRILGLLLGAAKAGILVVLFHMILGTLMAPENEMLRTCQTCPTLNEMSEMTRKIIKDEDIREALRQQTPAISFETFQGFLLQDSDVYSVPDQAQEMVIAPEKPFSIE